MELTEKQKYRRKYYQEHKEHELSVNRKWREEHPEQVMNYREKNKEFVREWATKNKEKVNNRRRQRNTDSIERAIYSNEKWTEEETTYLIENYQKMKIYEIADTLGRSYSSVERKRNKLKLRKREVS